MSFIPWQPQLSPWYDCTNPPICMFVVPCIYVLMILFISFHVFISCHKSIWSICMLQSPFQVIVILFITHHLRCSNKVLLCTHSHSLVLPSQFYYWTSFSSQHHMKGVSPLWCMLEILHQGIIFPPRSKCVCVCLCEFEGWQWGRLHSGWLNSYDRGSLSQSAGEHRAFWFLIGSQWAQLIHREPAGFIREWAGARVRKAREERQIYRGNIQSASISQ